MEGSKPDLGVDARALPVLVALSRRALTTGEVQKAVQMNGTGTRKYLLALQDAGFIIQRWDKKWVIVVRLAAVKVPGTAGEIVYEPAQDAQAPAGATQEGASAPTPDPPRSSAPRGVLLPPVVATKLPPKRTGAFQVSAAAKLAGERLKVPVWIRHRGEVAMAKGLEACQGCKRPTPLRYGAHPICPICARSTQEA